MSYDSDKDSSDSSENDKNCKSFQSIVQSLQKPGLKSFKKASDDILESAMAKSSIE